MRWKNLTPAQQVKLLNEQLGDIQRAIALIERFERITRTHLEKIQAQGAEKAN